MPHFQIWQYAWVEVCGMLTALCALTCIMRPLALCAHRPTSRISVGIVSINISQFSPL